MTTDTETIEPGPADEGETVAGKIGIDPPFRLRIRMGRVFVHFHRVTIHGISLKITMGHVAAVLHRKVGIDAFAIPITMGTMTAHFAVRHIRLNAFHIPILTSST